MTPKSSHYTHYKPYKCKHVNTAMNVANVQMKSNILKGGKKQRNMQFFTTEGSIQSLNLSCIIL